MEQQRLRTIALVGGAALALIVLSAGLHNVSLDPGRPLSLSFLIPAFGGSGGTQGGGSFPSWLGPLAAVGLVLSVIALIVSPALRRDLMRNLPAILLFTFGLYMIMRSSSQSIPPAEQSAPPPAAQPALGTSQPPMPDFISHPPEWLTLAITLALVVALLAGVFLLVRRLRQPKAVDLFVEEVREALADLRAGADLRDTISRCYSEMVRILSARRGVGRDASLTPREFELRLAAIGLTDTHIQRLTRLFERARYSAHTPGPADEREAEACLEAIIERLRPDDLVTR
jgi:hypothetical protein